MKKSTKGNILFVGPYPPQQRGGGEILTENLAKSIKNDGYNVYVLSMNSDKFYEKTEKDGIKIYRVDKFYKDRRYRFNLLYILRYFTIELFNPFMFLFTIYLILKHRINAVHMSTLHQVSFSPLIAAKLMFRRTVITFHCHELFCFFSSLLPSCYGIREGKCGACMFSIHKLPKSLARHKSICKAATGIANYLIKSLLFLNLKAAHLADYITFPSNYLKDFYIKYGLRERNTKVIYNFLSGFKTSRENVKRLKKSFGIRNEKVILFVGNMLDVKGPDILLKSFKMLKRKENLKLIFVGQGPLLEELKSKATELKLGRYVIFTGWVSDEDKRAIYDLSDIVVIPSIFPETFSLVFLEAFSAGKIVIASDIGALSENISDGSNGFLVKPNDPKALAGKLNYVISNYRRFAHMKRIAVNDARLKCNVRNLIKEYEGLYS